MAAPHRLRHHVGVFGSVPAYMREAMAAYHDYLRRHGA